MSKTITFRRFAEIAFFVGLRHAQLSPFPVFPSSPPFPPSSSQPFSFPSLFLPSPTTSRSSEALISSPIACSGKPGSQTTFGTLATEKNASDEHYFSACSRNNYDKTAKWRQSSTSAQHPHNFRCRCSRLESPTEWALIAARRQPLCVFVQDVVAVVIYSSALNAAQCAHDESVIDLLLVLVTMQFTTAAAAAAVHR